jgi:STE24 endopeptidase
MTPLPLPTGLLLAITEYAPPPEQYAKAVAYSRAHYFHFFVDAAYGVLVLLAVLWLRLGPRYRDFSERVSRRRLVQALLYVPLLFLTCGILGLPTDIWDQSLELQYGRSVQPWSSWLADWVTNGIIFLVVATILCSIFYAVVKRSPRRWWFYFWLASLPVLGALFFLQPLVIEPLFFKFEPLQPRQPVLVAEIQKVMRHGGIEIPADRMFEMNASTKLTGLNAYVSGFGASKRVVVWDTTLEKATIPETLFVFGHEMGHYVLYHIPKELGIAAVLVLFVLFLGFVLVRRLLASKGAFWGIRGLEDWASLPALLLVSSVLGFFASPVINTVSRYFEHEADRYGMEVIHGIVDDPNRVATAYFQKSGAMNLADPNPSRFIEFWFFDHPTRPQRVRFASTYDPWSGPGQPRYVR